MSIGFSNIPADLRVPLFYAEMDNSAANSASSTMRRLIVGQVNGNATSDNIGVSGSGAQRGPRQNHWWSRFDVGSYV